MELVLSLAFEKMLMSNFLKLYPYLMAWVIKNEAKRPESREIYHDLQRFRRESTFLFFH
jgi:hypothetical protein